MVAFTPTLLGCATFLSSVLTLVSAHQSAHTQTVNAIRARQAIYPRSQPNVVLQKRANQALVDFQGLHDSVASLSNQIVSKCQQIKTCKPSERETIGVEINHLIHQCGQQVKKCGGGGGGGSPPKPSKPSSVPGHPNNPGWPGWPGHSNPGSGTCAAVAGVYSQTVTTFHECTSSVSDILKLVPSLSETIHATCDDVSQDMSDLLDTAEINVTGVKNLVKSFTSHITNTRSSLLSKFFNSL